MTTDCLFVLSKSDTVYLVVFLNDLLLFDSTSGVENTKYSLGNVFTVTYLGRCSLFLGLKVDYGPNGLLLSQKAHAENVLKKFRIN